MMGGDVNEAGNDSATTQSDAGTQTSETASEEEVTDIPMEEETAADPAWWRGIKPSQGAGQTQMTSPTWYKSGDKNVMFRLPK